MQIGNSDVVCAALMSVGSFMYLFISDALPACCCNISFYDRRECRSECTRHHVRSLVQ